MKTNMLNLILKTFLCFALCFAMGNSIAQVNVEVLCFTSPTKPAIRFELRTYYDVSAKFGFGFVKYQKSPKPIPVIQSQVEAKSENKNAADEISTEWIEVNQGQATGKYLLTSQGASVISMTYERTAYRRKFSFEIDPNISASVQSGCQWGA